MSAQRPRQNYKDLLLTFGPALVLVILGFWLAWQFVSPAPPKTVTISTGGEQGAYYHFAQQYRQHLARLGIELEILTSSGSGENIARLLNKQADIAFVQSGTGGQQPLLSLGSLYYEPIWVFVNRKRQIDKLTDLKQARIAIGADGSGTKYVAEAILKLNQITEDNAELMSLTARQAATDLLQHKLDAAFFVASVEAPLVQNLLRNEAVYLLNLRRAESYMRLLPYLAEISLPEGVVDMHRNIPGQETFLLAAAANLVTREDLHSALKILLLQAADEIHGGNSVFANPDTFPNTDMPAFPISEEAERYYKVGPPFLMRYLPFWAAIFIDRMTVMLIPMLALILPLFKVMPPVYRWRVRSKIYRWYKELQQVDDAAFMQQLEPEKFQQLQQQLDRIEEEVNKVKTPLSYADQVYNLLLHIDLVRKKLNQSPSE